MGTPLNPNNKGASPITGYAPPVEHRFKPGHKPTGHRPKNAHSVRGAIRAILARNADPETGFGRYTMELAEIAVDAALGKIKMSPSQRRWIAWIVDQADGKLTHELLMRTDEMSGTITLHQGAAHTIRNQITKQTQERDRYGTGGEA